MNLKYKTKIKGESAQIVLHTGTKATNMKYSGTVMMPVEFADRFLASLEDGGRQHNMQVEKA